jgi:hypothetical protein
MKGLLLFFLLFSSMLKADNLIIITSANVSKLSSDTVYAIYTLRQVKWDSGVPITVAMLPLNSPESVEFAALVAGMSPQRLKRAQELSGIKSVGRVKWYRVGQEVADNLIEHYGGIGYVDKTVFVDSSLNIIELR